MDGVAWKLEDGHRDVPADEGWDWTGCELVERVPGKVSGQPIVRGTRILPDAIVGDYELGSPLEEIQENFPSLSIETIKGLIQFAHRQA